MEPKSDLIRKECWEKAFHCLATSYIFQKKAERLEKYLRYNTILGLVVPLFIGGVAATYGGNSNYLTLTLSVAAPFSIAQLILSGIALANKWDSSLSYSLESQSENRTLYESFQKLGKYPPTNDNELEKQFDIICIRDSDRTRQDEKVTFSEKENRKGMRYALWILRKECASCRLVPENMIASTCDTCGNY